MSMNNGGSGGGHWLAVVLAICLVGFVILYARNTPTVLPPRHITAAPATSTHKFYGETFREGADLKRSEQNQDVQPKDDLDVPFKSIDYESNPSGASTIPDGSAMTCYPKAKLSAEDLLPKEAANTKWAQINPVGTGALQNVNLLTAGYNLGVNTVGASHKNPNMSIRSDPPIPKLDVSPWLNSTIEPDTWRKKLEDY